MKQPKNKTRILFRYGLIIVAFLGLSGAVMAQLFRTTVLDAAAWNQKAKEELAKTETIVPERGDILSDNGSILACNVVVYDVCLDFRHPRLKDMHIPLDSLNCLADSLDKYYPRNGYTSATTDAERAEISWRSRFDYEMKQPFGERGRSIFLAKGVQPSDVEKIKHMPFLQQFAKYSGSRNPVYSKSRNQRIYPFGSIANLSIGRVNFDTARNSIHGYYGLERDLDSLLYGQPGVSRMVPTTSGMTSQVVTPAQKGMTLLTTINIDMQEMLEEELIRVCGESRAEWGTAILMEVKTGEIKAISSVELINGKYGESCNRAIEPFEPGSVMKPISMLIALEDGLVTNLNSTVDCSPFQKTTDHMGPKVKNIRQVIEMSSNTGMARIIFRGYADCPEKFYDRLASIGFMEPMHTGIAGEYTPKIPRLVDHDKAGHRITMTARHLSLARQAFGYATEIPPMYTLSVYNAIANDGKYVRPHLVRGIRTPEGRDSIFPISYIRDSICSRAHAAMLRECIKAVVWGQGTARAVQDDRVMIAGKTGTAFPVGPHGYDQSRRRFAFAGFFPYEEPKYSCMVLILAPGGNSAARTSGKVMLNMALKMYAHGMLSEVPSMGETVAQKPVTVASGTADKNLVARAYGVEGTRTLATPEAQKPGTVPNVVGYDLATAVRLLEQAGLKARIQGQGYVRQQSLAAGTPVKRGTTVVLTLKS